MFQHHKHIFITSLNIKTMRPYSIVGSKCGSMSDVTYFLSLHCDRVLYKSNCIHVLANIWLKIYDSIK